MKRKWQKAHYRFYKEHDYFDLKRNEATLYHNI